MLLPHWGVWCECAPRFLPPGHGTGCIGCLRPFSVLQGVAQAHLLQDESPAAGPWEPPASTPLVLSMASGGGTFKCVLPSAMA